MRECVHCAHAARLGWSAAQRLPSPKEDPIPWWPSLARDGNAPSKVRIRVSAGTTHQGRCVDGVDEHRLQQHLQRGLGFVVGVRNGSQQVGHQVEDLGVADHAANLLSSQGGGEEGRVAVCVMLRCQVWAMLIERSKSAQTQATVAIPLQPHNMQHRISCKLSSSQPLRLENALGPLLPPARATPAALHTRAPTSRSASFAAAWTLGCGSLSTSLMRGTMVGRQEPSCAGGLGLGLGFGLGLDLGVWVVEDVADAEHNGEEAGAQLRRRVPLVCWDGWAPRG